MARNRSASVAVETCPWCGRSVSEGVTVGPPPGLGERHAFELHAGCVDDWRAFVERARALAAEGARETLLSYPLENGTDDLVASQRR